MVISYNLDISTASVFAFLKLLFRWKASIWKIVLKELFIWTILYLLVTCYYKSGWFMNQQVESVFKRTAVYFGKYLNRSNLIFILGFFVSSVATRWNVLLQNIGFVESLALFVSGCIHGEDDESRMCRRTIVRNVCLAQCLVLRGISIRIRKRFPTMNSLVEAGFMTKKELEKFESFQVPYDKYWMPITWSVTHVLNARRSGKVMNDLETSKLVDELKTFRNSLQTLINYDWVPLPLVYPQLITISIYFYFIVCLFARQHFSPAIKNDVEFHFDIVLPVMTMVEFLFYVGWMKVAMNLLNSFGEDDDDLDCNFFIDKNLATGLCIVDTCRNVVPNLRSSSCDRFSGSFEKL
uniref:Bestrophin homolog n=1 Tax=Onchocerca volvulus TaxID=6282 RepID=A0A8R1Y218_ONCVO